MNKSVKYSPPAQLPIQILLIRQAFLYFVHNQYAKAKFKGDFF